MSFYVTEICVFIPSSDVMVMWTALKGPTRQIVRCQVAFSCVGTREFWMFECCRAQFKLALKVWNFYFLEGQDWLQNLKSKVPRDCGSFDGDRIFGGSQTKLNEFPWTTLLSYYKSEIILWNHQRKIFKIFSRIGETNSSGFHCGGSLINDRYVLTGWRIIFHKKIDRKKTF